ncbi:hypothetical protein ACQ4WX_34370 [Streptomyces lasalocidi]
MDGWLCLHRELRLRGEHGRRLMDYGGDEPSWQPAGTEQYVRTCGRGEAVGGFRPRTSRQLIDDLDELGPMSRIAGQATGDQRAQTGRQLLPFRHAVTRGGVGQCRTECVYVTHRARLSARGLLGRQAAGIETGRLLPCDAVRRCGSYCPEAGEPGTVRGDQYGGRAEPGMGQALPVNDGEVLGQRDGECPDRRLGQRASVDGQGDRQWQRGQIRTRTPGLFAGGCELDGGQDPAPEEIAGGFGLGHEALWVDTCQGPAQQHRAVTVGAAGDEAVLGDRRMHRDTGIEPGHHRVRADLLRPPVTRSGT